MYITTTKNSTKLSFCKDGGIFFGGGRNQPLMPFYDIFALFLMIYFFFLVIYYSLLNLEETVFYLQPI